MSFPSDKMKAWCEEIQDTIAAPRPFRTVHADHGGVCIGADVEAVILLAGGPEAQSQRCSDLLYAVWMEQMFEKIAPPAVAAMFRETYRLPRLYFTDAVRFDRVSGPTPLLGNRPEIDGQPNPDVWKDYPIPNRACLHQSLSWIWHEVAGWLRYIGQAPLVDQLTRAFRNDLEDRDRFPDGFGYLFPGNPLPDDPLPTSGPPTLDALVKTVNEHFGTPTSRQRVEQMRRAGACPKGWFDGELLYAVSQLYGDCRHDGGSDGEVFCWRSPVASQVTTGSPDLDKVRIVTGAVTVETRGGREVTYEDPSNVECLARLASAKPLCGGGRKMATTATDLCLLFAYGDLLRRENPMGPKRLVELATERALQANGRHLQLARWTRRAEALTLLWVKVE